MRYNGERYVYVGGKFIDRVSNSFKRTQAAWGPIVSVKRREGPFGREARVDIYTGEG